MQTWRPTQQRPMHMAAFIEEVAPSTLVITEVGGAGMLHSISGGQ